LTKRTATSAILPVLDTIAEITKSNYLFVYWYPPARREAILASFQFLIVQDALMHLVILKKHFPLTVRMS